MLHLFEVLIPDHICSTLGDMLAVVLFSKQFCRHLITRKKSRIMKRLLVLQTKPDSSYGLPLETGCPSCPVLRQLFLFLFLKAEEHDQRKTSAGLDRLLYTTCCYTESRVLKHSVHPLKSKCPSALILHAFCTEGHTC